MYMSIHVTLVSVPILLTATGKLVDSESDNGSGERHGHDGNSSPTGSQDVQSQGRGSQERDPEPTDGQKGNARVKRGQDWSMPVPRVAKKNGRCQSIG